ncbi:Hypothetical protein CAP_1011 [Chondromyces apiculatus DSM 436]|uniref:Uncharacterized protein n=1 Tax=Chondromyces apiculatus DSM 436 TaxID=1192034 RepID=A0A017TE49_9BACT|nr:Hypothetical protein CAP_1011 [Chondromyces apiculatus DSM 436]
MRTLRHAVLTPWRRLRRSLEKSAELQAFQVRDPLPIVGFRPSPRAARAV